MNLHSFSLTVIILLLVVLAAVIWLVLRGLGFLRFSKVENVLAGSAPVGDKVSAIAEAIILLCVGGIIFIFTATNTSTGGRMLILDELHPVFASVNLTVAVCAGVCLLLSVLVCLFWRTSVATILAAFVLIVYATLLNGPGELLEKMVGEEATERQVIWKINIGGCDVKGAELWVNGNRLGTLPYTTTPEEFKSKVPFWPDPPTEMQDKEDRWKIPRYTPWGSGGYGSSWRRWAKIVMPGESAKHWGSSERDSEEERKSRTYYAQVKFGDEWGYSRGGGGGGSGGKYIYHSNTTIGKVRFPEREKCMETLLDKARLADYQPTDEWFSAIETFGEDAVIAIREIIAKEPQMEDVLKQWARRKYKLDQVNNEMSAWRAFKAICGEADSERAYSTASIAGKAVELLVPMLDSETLAKKAIKIIRSTNRYGWYHWQLAGQKHFGFAERPKGLRTGSQRTMGEWRGGGGNKLPIHAYAVAHAVWKMDEWLDVEDPHHENIIEQKVVPEFLARNYEDINRIKLAIYIGSKALDHYLIRQNWRADGKELPFNQQMHGSGNDTNGWLYLLTKLYSPTGEKFRQENLQLIMKMVDGFMEYAYTDSAEELEFLFIDLDKGEKSLAYQCWPRFKKLSQKRKYYAIEMQYEYLIKMEPASTAEMYVNAFREFHDDYSWVSTAFSELKKLPDPKKELVYVALRKTVEEDVSNISGWSGSDPNGLRDYLLRELEGVLSMHMLAEKILNNLYSEKPNAKPERVKDWLANAEPSHPLMPMLADDENPAFRMLVLDAIKAHPTPANRKILEKLLKDQDYSVQAGAQEVADYLEEISNIPLEELVSQPVTKEVQG